MQSAVLSALIFNAIIIPLLIPLAMRGIAFKPTSTMTLFLKNTLIYGVGGVIVPFVGIKLIDLLLVRSISHLGENVMTEQKERKNGTSNQS